jgi:hypothetical protein
LLIKEAAMSAASAATNTINDLAGPCGLENTTEFYKQNENGFKFECDLMDGDCSLNFDDLLKFAEKSMGVVTHTYTENNKIHSEYQSSCDWWKQALAANISITANSENEMSSKSGGVEGDHDIMRLEMCIFGKNLQAKCGKKDDYDALLSDIEGTGTEFSVPDRKVEYGVAQEVLCIIDQFVAGETADLDKCNEVNYLAEVGDLDYKSADVSAKMRGVYYTCSEKTVNIPGGTWTLDANPVSHDIKSTHYHRVDEWNPSITLTDANSPFEYCDSSAYPNVVNNDVQVKTCANGQFGDLPISCLKGQVAKSNFATIKCTDSDGLCTLDDCCKRPSTTCADGDDDEGFVCEGDRKFKVYDDPGDAKPLASDIECAGDVCTESECCEELW